MPETIPINANFHEVHYSEHYSKWLESKSERYKEYRKKWTDNPVNFINEGYPLNLDIDASSSCNLRCPMCPRTIASNDKNGNMRHSKNFDFDIYRRLIDEASDLGIYAVKLLWLGEPLMNPHIVDMVRYAKEKNIEDVILTTNAVLLSEELSKGFINAGLDKLYFSFDSHQKELYEKIRVGASFESVLQNIIRFHEIRKEMNSLGPTTRAAMVSMQDNRDSFEEYKSFFSEIVDVVAFYDYVDYEKDYTFLKERKDIRFACSQLWQRLHVAADGEIAICCFDHNAEIGIGSIRDMTIEEAWNSDELNRIRALHQDMQWHNVGLCGRCPVVEFGSSGSV